MVLLNCCIGVGGNSCGWLLLLMILIGWLFVVKCGCRILRCGFNLFEIVEFVVVW